MFFGCSILFRTRHKRAYNYYDLRNTRHGYFIQINIRINIDINTECLFLNIVCPITHQRDIHKVTFRVIYAVILMLKIIDNLFVR